MLLIQTMKWFGPGRLASQQQRIAIERTNTPTSYATALPLSEALESLRAYDDEFAAHYEVTAVEHTLIGVQTIPEMSADDMDTARIWSVEGLLSNLRAVCAEEAEQVA